MFLLRKSTCSSLCFPRFHLFTFSDHELLKSKGVAHALQRVNTERAFSRASTLNHPYSQTLNNELPTSMFGRESVLSGRPPSSINQYPTSTPISQFGLSTNLTTSIENPITNLQEYCKANMVPIDIKTEVCDPDPKNPNQRKLLLKSDFFSGEISNKSLNLDIDHGLLWTMMIRRSPMFMHILRSMRDDEHHNVH